MITREQAEQAFQEYSKDFTLTYEMRNPHFEVVNGHDIGSEDLEDDLYVDIEETAWLCTYERKYKTTNDTWQRWQWNMVKCYIVEAKPGPYVIE